ncbi:MAG TPA: 4Fe-4S binding protein [Bradyrhizobium sp.]|nr:4Fe-4S binding protein [Bradyrhizobium sp.]
MSSGPTNLADLNESEGRSADAAASEPKRAALLAASAESTPDVPLIDVESGGVVLVYGRGEEAVEAGVLLKEHLDVTVMIEPRAAISPPHATEFPVVKGKIRTAKGHFGGFELTVDDFAVPVLSLGGVLSFGPSRDGAVSRCDIILDVSGGNPLFTAVDLRDGYLRADPDHCAAVRQATSQARDLVGAFARPRYIDFHSERCARSRSGIIGCTRCLDLCPAGAIAPAGDRVKIDPHICAGCGQCAAVCPTGAASYTMPPADALMRKVRAMLSAYRQAGGERAMILIHDDPHGAPLIDALAEFGGGVPANVLPLGVNETMQVGLETIAAAFAYGASALRFLARSRPRQDVTGLTRSITLANSILAGLGFGESRVATIETDDPDSLGEALRAIPLLPPAPRPASFLPMGEKPNLLREALRELHRASPDPVERIVLPQQAPFGTVEIDVAACTLCLSCVSACPTGALRDDPERPMLRFVEDACVQCGLCKATCPENAISLGPQLNFVSATEPSRVLKQEEPFCCIRCSKAFGVKSTIERLTAKLQEQSWMYKASPGRLDLIKMCSDCRVAFVWEEKFDPHAAQVPAHDRQNARWVRRRDI